MINKSCFALAALLCGSVAFATPGAFSTWFTDAVASHPTGWTKSDKVDGSVAVTSDATVTYTAAEAATTAYVKETITITSGAMDFEDLESAKASVTEVSGKFAFVIAQATTDPKPFVYVLSADGAGASSWKKTSITATEDTATAVAVEYSRANNTFKVGGVEYQSLTAAGDIQSTAFIGNGAVNALTGDTAGVGVAMIEGVGYDTLAEAITAAGTTKTIDLTADVTLPTGAATYKINTNGFTVDTPEGYISSVNGSTVAVTAASGETTAPSFLWNNDFTVSCVDANQTGWSFYKPSNVTASTTGMSVGGNGGPSLLARTKNATIAAGVSVVLRAKGLAKPASGNRALIRVKNGNAVGVSVNAAGQFVGIANDDIDWGDRSGAFVEKAAEVERTFVLTFVYGETVKLYELIGARTVAKVWEASSGLSYSSLAGKGFNEIALLGMWNTGSFSGATMTGLAIYNGTIISTETMANIDWESPAPNKATYAASDVAVEHFGYITETATMIWPNLTLDNLKGREFVGTMNGDWVAADTGADSGKIGYWANCPTTVEKTETADSIILDFQRSGDKTENKFVRVTLTEADGGIKAAAVAGTSKGGTNSTLATDDTAQAYGIKYISATKPVVATIDETPYYSVEEALAAVVAAPTKVAVFVEALDELPVAYAETCVLTEDGLQAWAKRTVYVTNTDGTNFALEDGTTVVSTALREGDTLTYKTGHYSGNQWQVHFPTVGYPILVDYTCSSYGIPAGAQVELKSGAILYFQGANDLNAGAKVFGEGKLSLNVVGTVKGAVTVTSAFEGTGSFKLEDAATLTVANELAAGKVTVGEGRFVKFDEETKTYSSAHLAATIGDDKYETLAAALDAAKADKTLEVTIVDGTTTLPEGYDDCIIVGSKAWAKRTVYVVDASHNLKISVGESLETLSSEALRQGDTIVYDKNYGSNRWGDGVSLNGFTGYPITIGIDMNVKHGGIPANQVVTLNQIIYVYGNVGAGAQISGTGTLDLSYESSSTIGAGTEISAPVKLLAGKTAIINGLVTITGAISNEGAFKLADGATLKVLTALTVGAVESNVSTKGVATATEGEYTVYTLEALPPVPGTITVAPGATPLQVVVTVPVANAAGQTVTVTATDKNGATVSGTATVTDGQAVVTIDGAKDTGYTFEAKVGETSLGEGAFFTGNVWFGAYPHGTTESLVNGEWDVTPTITDGNYVVNSSTGNKFTVTNEKKGEGNGKRTVMTHVVTFTSAIDPEDLPTVDGETLGAITVANDGLGGAAGGDAQRYVWMGVKNGAWTTLEGATPVLNTEYTVTVTYDPTAQTFTYAANGVTLGSTTAATGFSGVTAVGSGTIKKIEATVGDPLPAAEGYLTAAENGKPIRVDDAFASALVPAGDHAAVQTALNANVPDGALKVWQAYALGATAAQAQAGVKPVISGAQTSDTDKMKLVDGFTVRENTGITVTRTVKVGTAPTSLTEDETATRSADGVTVTLPTTGDKVKYIKIDYTFE